MPETRALALVLTLPFALAACSRPAAPSGAGAASPAPSAVAVSPPPPWVAATANAVPAPASAPVGEVVAEVNGSRILASELDERAAGRLSRLRQEEYEIRRQALDQMVADRLVAAEAARRGLAPEELLRQEVDAKAAAPSASQVDAIYEQNKERFAGQTRDAALARIREVLGGRAKSERRAAFEQGLRDRARVSVWLEAPRAAVDVPAGAPATGPATAPVTIVEFTDYQCPYCHRVQATIDQLLARYAGKVRLVHMDFPLDGHPGAVPAARAARCAGEQGKFWEYHRGLMTGKGTLDDADLRGRAASLGLDAAAFAGCLTSGRHDEAIQASFRQGEALGVTGTPAYFVNGRMLSGAQPYEEFARVVDAEL
jgi:protein-disulfide isomerase